MQNCLLYNYIENNISKPPKYLNDIEQKIKNICNDYKMMSDSTQGRLLSIISKIYRPNKILEIGTFYGYSALCLAEGLNSKGILITLEKNKELKNIINDNILNSPYKNHIKVIFGNAEETIQNLAGDFDFIYIDANKLYYKKYYNFAIEKLIPGGIIIIDNVLWKNEVLNTKKNKIANHINQLNNFIANDQRVENIIIPLRDGLNIIRKKILL